MPSFVIRYKVREPNNYQRKYNDFSMKSKDPKYYMTRVLYNIWRGKHVLFTGL